MLSPAPVPPPPVITEEATAETATTSETSSEANPPQSAVRARDYAYHASRLRERDERQPQRSRTPVPSSPGSTRMSDYGLLSSPQVDQRKMKAPVQINHFEIERGSGSTKERMNRSWSMRRKKEVIVILTAILLSYWALIGYPSPCLLRLSGSTSVPRRFLLLLQRRI